MKNDSFKELNNSIDKLSTKIKRLKSRIDICEESNRTYNRLMIERACLRQQLKEFQMNNIVAFMYNKNNSKIKQKRICDYFKF